MMIESLEHRTLLAQAPFGEAPYTAPGLIEAENFDLGGEGEAFHDNDSIRQGTSAYRPDDAVDLDAKGANGVSVGYIRAGEWLEYTIRFDEAGTYRIDTSVASKTGGYFHYAIDDVDVTGSIQLPNTTGWSTFKTIKSNDFTVAGGTHVVRLSFDRSTVSTDIGVVDAFNIVKINDEEEFHPDRLNWKSVANSPIEREEAQSLVYDGKLYVLGGYRRGFTATKRVDAYDPATNKWKKMRDLPYSITHAAVTPDPDGHTFWFLGGFEGSFKKDEHGHSHGPPATKKVYRYDAATDTWTRGPNMPNSHGGGGAGIIDGKLYFFGGADLHREYDRKEMYVLDLANQSAGWTRGTDFISPRNHLGGIVVNGKLYSIGGQYGLEDESDATKRVDVYDPSTSTWNQVADMPESLSHFNAATVLYDRYIITVGGENPHNVGKKHVFCYDTEKNEWFRMTDLPGSRRAGVAGIVRTKLVQSTGYYQPQGQTTTTWVAELKDVFG
jgi:N-acetylneuraminic acid mutarotase